jgi:hypothetical protein
MSSETVCKGTRSWVDVGSFQRVYLDSYVSLSSQSGNFWTHHRKYENCQFDVLKQATVPITEIRSNLKPIVCCDFQGRVQLLLLAAA